jgi:hypothetical protein
MTGKRCTTAACGICALSTAQSSVCCCCCCCRRWSSRHPSHDEPQASKPKHGDQARQARQIAVNFVQNPGSYATITEAAQAVGYPQTISAETALHKAHRTVRKKLKQGAMPSPTVSPLVSPSAAAAASAPEEPTPAGSTPANDASTNDPATAPPQGCGNQCSNGGCDGGTVVSEFGALTLPACRRRSPVAAHHQPPAWMVGRCQPVWTVTAGLEGMTWRSAGRRAACWLLRLSRCLTVTTTLATPYIPATQCF